MQRIEQNRLAASQSEEAELMPPDSKLRLTDLSVATDPNVSRANNEKKTTLLELILPPFSPVISDRI
jgi:hypothetical protein